MSDFMKSQYKVIGTLLALIGGVFTAVLKLHPENTEEIRFSFILFFFESITIELKSFFLLFFFGWVLYLILINIFKEFEIFFGENYSKLTLVYLVIFFLTCFSSLAFLAISFQDDSYHIARARYYYWKELFYTEYKYDLLEKAKKFEQAGFLEDAIKKYNVDHKNAIIQDCYFRN